MRHLTSMVSNVKIDEPQKTSQIENMNKLHHYRELKRNRNTKETSLFNKMSYRDNKRNMDFITEDSMQNQTSLQW
jgi:hypothetical protein